MPNNPTGATAGPPQEPMTIREALRVWNRPPRAHGEVIEDRTVSFLELFYDLVFVVLVAEIAHTLAGHISWDGVGRFIVVFLLIWMAWLTGTMYHELHGRDDGRSRTFIFGQMIVLAVLAVFTAHAADDPDDGRAFAITYTILVGLQLIQWFQVWQIDSPENRVGASRYLISNGALAVMVFSSAFVNDPTTRVWMWLLGVLLVLVPTAFRLIKDAALAANIVITDSMAERFGLFTIIVLGEVVVGAVEGLSESERTIRSFVTTVIALCMGFGVWWNYFDFVGRKVPYGNNSNRTLWIYAHLPVAVGIAALGAGFVGLIEHADASRTPTSTAWLVGGALAVTSAATAVLSMTMFPHPGRRFVPISLSAAAVGSLVVAALRPTPWLFALLGWLMLIAVWCEAFARHARTGYPLAET